MGGGGSLCPGGVYTLPGIWDTNLGVVGLCPVEGGGGGGTSFFLPNFKKCQSFVLLHDVGKYLLNLQILFCTNGFGNLLGVESRWPVHGVGNFFPFISKVFYILILLLEWWWAGMPFSPVYI